jgi:ethanolamine ammonia-lyase large subunit
MTGRLKPHTARVGAVTYTLNGLVELMAKATPRRSGDELAGCAASSDAERAAAQWALADTSLNVFLEEMVVPYEDDEVTRLIIDSHDRVGFQRISHLTVGGLRDWLLDVAAGPDRVAAAATLAGISRAITPEMAAAVSKIMRNQDLIAVARAITVTSAFRTTVGLPGTLATRLQPNHPTDDPRGIAAATLDGLLPAAATPSLASTRPPIPPKPLQIYWSCSMRSVPATPFPRSPACYHMSRRPSS